MFAPKIANPQSKAAASSTRSLARRSSALSAQCTSNLNWNRFGRDHEPEARSESPTAREVPPGARWDFGKVSVFPPDRAGRPPPVSALAAKPLPGTIQAKLLIGPVDDPLEREADRAADEVTRMPDPALSITPAPWQISRKCAACKEEEKAQAVQRKNVHDDVVRSAGRPLDAPTRAFFETRFGRDFSSVRIHFDDSAAASARSISSNASTIGRDVVFASGRYSPTTPAGRKLLAHELTHVVQQNSGQVPGLIAPTIQRQPDSKSDGSNGQVDTAKTEFYGGRLVQSLAEDCPNEFDKKVIQWLYPKAEQVLFSPAYTSDRWAVIIIRSQTWKTPSKWGEGDYDIFYSKIPSVTPQEKIFEEGSKASENHIKLVARFQSIPVRGPGKDFVITGDFIDWLDGHPIVRRSWQGKVHVNIELGFWGFKCKSVDITDLAASPAPAAPPTPAPPSRSRPG